LVPAKRLAAGGFIVLAGCWKFTSAEPALVGGVSHDRIACPKNLASVDDSIAALIEVGRALPGVKNDAMGIFGIGGGGEAALKTIGIRSDIRAAAVDSPFVWREGLQDPSKVSSVKSPVLLVGGTAGVIHPIAEPRQYEKALREAGKTVEAHYYEGQGDGPTLNGPPAIQDDAMRRIVDFFRRYLK
jgi:dipeptidyl aminopeptidase/acylaminoacyl peptidase